MRKMMVVAFGAFILLVIQNRVVFAAEPLFAALEKRLIEEGMDETFIQSIYQHPSVQLEPQILAGNLKRQEKTLDYNQYLTDEVVAKGKQYLNENQIALDKAFKEFGVPPAMIVAILMVETRLGVYTGKYPTINVFSTMAVADDERVQEKIFAFFANEMSKADFQKQVKPILKKRVVRGHREIKALLEYLEKNQVDPFTIKGSSEGAIGIPQFLPSNINHYAQDGDGDGVVDLFNHADAISSAAAFLAAHKWKKAQSEKQKKQVLLHYNRSIYYVDAIYALAERLEEEPPLPVAAEK